MAEFNTVGLEDIIESFSRREQATVEAVPKMLEAGADVLVKAQQAEAQAMGLNDTGGFVNSIKAKTKEVLKAAGFYINSVDMESYETETGYWIVPITIEYLKEREEQ